MNWRWHLYWVIDFLKGSPVRKAYNEQKESYYYKGNKNDLNKEKLKMILTHARNHTTFYSNIKVINIREFPIIDKSMLIKQKTILLANNKKSARKMCTSGSTGTPLDVLQCKCKVNRVAAEVIFWGEIAGYKFGEKQAYFRVWNELNRKNKFKAFFQNLQMVDISLQSKEILELILKFLKKEKTKSILVYASALDEIVSNYKNINICFSDMKGVISASETLQEQTRIEAEKIFKCSVLSRYSNQENGILAQEDLENKDFILNESNYYIEFLKLDSDKEAKEGEISRIVITDLYNFVMPIIRYDTGDTCIYKNDEYQNKIITSIYGRRCDFIYNTAGEILSRHSICNNMWGTKGVKQYKFIQTSKKDYTVEINPEKNVNKKELKKTILEKFLPVFGLNANIKVKYVNEIPILKSGKRKIIENRMENK